MRVFEVRVRIDEKADLVWPVTVTPRGSAEQVTGAPGSQAPGGKRMARESLTETGHSVINRATACKWLNGAVSYGESCSMARAFGRMMRPH
jgi:hypothetical protein